MIEPLTSWTRTLNEEDALVLVDAARAGTSVDEWTELADRLLPQANSARRRELIRIVREDLLDIRAGAILDSAWLRLFHDGSPIGVSACCTAACGGIVRSSCGPSTSWFIRRSSAASVPSHPTFRYAAPEVLKTGEATPRSDLFSLGATLLELFTGRSLFANVDEVLRPFSVPPLHIGGRPCPRAVADLVTELLAVEPAGRPRDAAIVAHRLEQAVHVLTREPIRTELAPGTEIRETYELVERLGRGATATTWKARHLQTDHIVVLKIADSGHAHYLQEEGRVLGAVSHPNLVRFHNVEPFEDGNFLVLEYVEGFTATLWAAAGDPLDPPRFIAVALGLLGALGALHQAGWIHRDVKPDNVMLTIDAAPKLLDVGLAARLPVEGDLAVGSIRYKDPRVYVDNCWAPASDLFSASLVLYELFTGTHPFGGGPPEPNQRPTIQAEEFPDSYDAKAIARIAGWFARALSPVAADRPHDAASAIRTLEEAVGTSAPPRADPGAGSAKPVAGATLALLPASAELGASIASLDLSTRAQGALARLGLAIVADLVGFDPASARGLANVGSKTIRELVTLKIEVEARWPGQARAERGPSERFYPALADDMRPLDELGRELTRSIKDALMARGVFSIGDLASMPPAALEVLPSIGPGKLARVRAALRRLAGRERLPETLAELDDLLKDELGESAWKALAHVIGLGDGRARSQTEAAGAIGVSRQRVSQSVDLEPLRAEASWAHHLVTVVGDAMPPAGFATLETAAAALAARLPTSEAGPSSLGYARLAGLLLRPEARASDAPELRWVIRPPWTDERILDLQRRLAGIGGWPPVARLVAEGRLWDETPFDIQRALVRWGADATQLLSGLLTLDDHVLVDRFGGLHTPPVELWSAIAVLRPTLVPQVDTDTLVAAAHAAYLGVAVADDAGAVELAIERAGYQRDGDLWADPARIEIVSRLDDPRIDPSIPTQRVGSDRRPPVVAALASQVDRGGFRVVALSPATHHAFARRLATWIGESIGADRVQFVAIDRLIIDTLKAHDLWKFVPYLEARTALDSGGVEWRMFHAELSAALDLAVRDARPGAVLVLGQPSLLGLLGMMPWLSGFYERARGGVHGLVVLAVPGGIHEDRVRLNEKYNLPYTPDMAAVYLDAEVR